MPSLDCAERAFKRQKLEHVDSRPLPTDVLLLSLPHLLAHPPVHKHHTRSLFMTLFALRRCLSLQNLDSVVECRAWTELAEVGLKIGLDEPGIESEVGKGITKALMIINKHPSLRIYKPQLTHLSARLASYQKNPKLAQNSLKKVLTNFLAPSDPPNVTYTAHLAYISSLSGNDDDDDSPPYSPTSTSSKSIGAIRDLFQLAARNGHSSVGQLAMVLELRDLMQNGVWTRMAESLKSNEQGLNITLESNSTEKSTSSTSSTMRTNLETVLVVHVLMIGVIYYTYAGDSANAQTRLKQLHDMLDGGAIDAFGESGIIEVPLPASPPLQIQVTHPRVIFALGFLVSSVSKRDPVGRKPKRKLFAGEGIIAAEKEIRKEILLPPWASIMDVRIFQDRMHKMKADMMCELVGVSISRSECQEAEHHLAQVIAYTRTHNLFSLYSARISLHQAHLSHALGQAERALKCYQVAAFLSRRRLPSDHGEELSEEADESCCEDYWVNVSARAGELWLRVGLASEETDEEAFELAMKPLRKAVKEVAQECEGLRGTLQAVGAVLVAVVSKEFLLTKSSLRTALNLCTAAQDNHLRALVLALVAAQYVHTSTEHAETMLGTAEQLAAGLGAQPKAAKTPELKTGTCKAAGAAVGGDGVGNVHLRLWIGERCLELKRRAADEWGALKQAAMNEKLKTAVARVQKRKFTEVE